jgi:hypothetical protein
MYPLTEDALPLHELATHWARGMPERPPWEEVLLRLIASMWRGELDVINPEGATDVRCFLLIVLALLPDGKRVRIFPDAASMRESVKGLPERVAAFDTRTSIILPDDKARWDTAVIGAACAVLAETRLEDHSKEFLAVLMMQVMCRTEFERHCLSRGYALPPFWFGPQRRKVSTAKAQRDYEVWLKRLVASGPKPGGKTALWLQAKAMFPRLSRHAFDEIWLRTVPASWSEPGALPGPRASKSPRSAIRQ